MGKLRRNDALRGELFLEGQRVPPGLYRQVGSEREVCLEIEDYLPASPDGRMACYERILCQKRGPHRLHGLRSYNHAL